MIQANLLLSRHFIKINALLIGYGLWILLSQYQIITRKIQVPLCFYKTEENSRIIAPDTIDILVSAPRKSFLNFDTYNSAIHIDGSRFVLGNNYIFFEKENLFLPDTINLLNLIPSHIQIQLQKIE